MAFNGPNRMTLDQCNLDVFLNSTSIHSQPIIITWYYYERVEKLHIFLPVAKPLCHSEMSRTRQTSHLKSNEHIFWKFCKLARYKTRISTRLKVPHGKNDVFQVDKNERTVCKYFYGLPLSAWLLFSKYKHKDQFHSYSSIQINTKSWRLSPIK